MIKKLDNKVAIITSGAGGIGKAIAIEFLNQGSVYNVDGGSAAQGLKGPFAIYLSIVWW